MTAPSAVGTLADTPLAHALIYARNRRLTGRLELTTTDERRAAVSLWRGRITAVETVPLGLCPGGFFGAVVYELGFIDSATLDATLLEIAKTKRLHGEVLIERKAITPAQRDEALVEQVHRKVHHLFTFPETTAYAFYDAKPTIDPPVAVDPVGPVWRGIRDYPPTKFVQETLRRVGDSALRVMAGGAARLPPAETALAETLATRPMTVTEMKQVTELPPSRVELLVYLLVIAKCVESVSGVRTHPSTGALPIRMPSGPVSIPPMNSEVRRLSPPTPTIRPSGISSIVPPPSSQRIPISGIPKMPTPLSSSKAVQKISSTKIPAAPSSSPRPPAVAVAALRSPAEVGIDGILAHAGTIDDEDYFDVLGVNDGAPPEAVRAAFIRLAKTWHPDRVPADLAPLRDEVAKIFAAMTRAQQVLCDDTTRRAYLAARKATKPEPRSRTEVARELTHAMSRRDFERIVLLCQEMIDANGEDAEALAIQAWASIRGGEDATEEVLRATLARIDKAVNLDRTNDQAIYHRGLIHKRLGNNQSAIRDFARTVQLNPKHVDAEREVRIYAMRAKKGSGEHKLVTPILEKLGKK